MLVRILSVVLLLFVLNLNLVVAESAKSFEMLDVELVKSGTLNMVGNVRAANLFLYVPQENLKSIEVSPNSWSYVDDKFGNRMIKIHWDNPGFVERYEVKMRVVNYAKHYEELEEEDWKFTEEAKKETNLTSVSDEIRSLAYGNETTLEKAVRLSIWINKNLKYDLQPLKEKTESAQWTFENKRGVCGEYSNLLAAMLRSQGIPVRYVVGYAFPQISNQTQNEPWMHAWVEVLIDNKWVPFDPTWLEGGFLDATHIKFANLLDSSYAEQVSWTGFGSVDWTKDDLKLSVLDSSHVKTILDLEIKETVNAGSIELAQSLISGSCSLLTVDLKSCVEESGNPMFNVFDSRRDFWFCNQAMIYWLFEINKEREDYICPMVLYSQDGAKAEDRTTVYAYYPENLPKNIFIEGPEQVAIGENFKIKVEEVGKFSTFKRFFSPNLTENVEDDEWELKIKKDGVYKFYFHSQEYWGEKIINVVDKKEVQFVSVEKPRNVTVRDWFLFNVTAKNLLNSTTLVVLKVRFENQTFSRSVDFNPYEEKTEGFNITANEIGAQKLFVASEGRSFSSYSVSVDVIEKRTVVGMLKKIILLVIEKLKAFLYRI